MTYTLEIGPVLAKLVSDSVLLLAVTYGLAAVLGGRGK